MRDPLFTVRAVVAGALQIRVRVGPLSPTVIPLKRDTQTVLALPNRLQKRGHRLRIHLADSGLELALPHKLVRDLNRPHQGVYGICFVSCDIHSISSIHGSVGPSAGPTPKTPSNSVAKG